LIRKILKHGNSRTVSLPKSWLSNAEEEAGKKIVALALEVNNVITVAPVFEKIMEPTKKEKQKQEVEQNG